MANSEIAQSVMEGVINSTGKLRTEVIQSNKAGGESDVGFNKHIDTGSVILSHSGGDSLSTENLIQDDSDEVCSEIENMVAVSGEICSPVEHLVCNDKCASDLGVLENLSSQNSGCNIKNDMKDVDRTCINVLSNEQNLRHNVKNCINSEKNSIANEINKVKYINVDESLPTDKVDNVKDDKRSSSDKTGNVKSKDVLSGETEDTLVIDKTLFNTQVDECEEETGDSDDDHPPFVPGTSNIINPFVHRIHWRFPYDYIKVVLLSVFVAPLRVLGILLSLVIAWIFSSVGLYKVDREQLSAAPIRGWRGVVKLQVRWWVRQICTSCGFHWLVCRGMPASPKEAPVLVLAPHSSFFDTLPVLGVGAPSVVAKGEIHHVPVLGKYIDYTQPVYVWRESTNSRQNTIQEIMYRATSKDNWPQVMVFPEGTCTNRQCLVTFKPGAFYPGVPVQPVLVRYPNTMDTITWTWDGPGALQLLWLTLCQVHNYCEIEYLPVYTPSEAEKNDAHLFAANVRQVMSKALGVPVADYSYDDCRLMHLAVGKNLPSHNGLIEFQKIRHRFGLDTEEVKGELLNRYASMAGKDGAVRLEDFARYLALPHTEPAVVALFNLYDKHGRGDITYREYLVGLCRHTRPACTTSVRARAYAALDVQRSGAVTAEELQAVLGQLFGATADQANSWFSAVDVDKKGHVTLGDFELYMTRKPELCAVFSLYTRSLAAHVRQSNTVQPPPGKRKAE